MGAAIAASNGYEFKRTPVGPRVLNGSPIEIIDDERAAGLADDLSTDTQPPW